jgi:excisionase family DNA binding protein
MSTLLLTVNEAAERLQMSRRSLYRLIETDQLPTVRGFTPGAPIRIRVEDVDAFIARRTTPGTVTNLVAS